MAKRTTENLADAAEIALLHGVGGTSSSALAGTLRVKESVAEDARALVARRAQQLGDRHPFEASGAFLSASHEAPGYRALLALSVLVDEEIKRGNEVLDRLVAAALPRLLGEPCRVINFAWPPAVSHDPRPTGFSEAVKWLGDRLGLDYGTGYRSPARQDGGVDLVAVRELAGSTKAVPTLLVQTTLSRDTRTKGRDIDLDLWRTWIDLSPATLSCLAVPFDVPADDVDELHRSGVVVLDRMRLAELLGDDGWDNTQCRMDGEWVTAVLAARAQEWFR